MQAKDIPQYKQWSDRGYPFSDDDILRWTAATIANVNDLTEIVSNNFSSFRMKDRFTRWLFS